MQQPPGYPPGGNGPPPGGYGPPPGGGGYGPPPGGGGYGPPPGGGGYGPPPGGGGPYGPPPGGGGYGPPPGGGYGPPPGGGGYGMVGGPPPKKGMSVAAIVLIALVVLSVSGLGGCLVCVYAIGGGSKSTSAQADEGAPAQGSWITSERPFVKFRKPAGWSEDLKGDWGIFKSPDGTAVFAFTTFSHPGESTVRLGRAASVLGVSDVAWGSPTFGTIGPESFKAHMGEGSCTFEGTTGDIWYATVDPGSVEQILLIYTVSGRGTKTDRDAVIASVKSLRHR